MILRRRIADVIHAPVIYIGNLERNFNFEISGELRKMRIQNCEQKFNENQNFDAV